ncbi:MAG: hypothetical protein R2822_05045 [Spirosomataceae bacterium]
MKYYLSKYKMMKNNSLLPLISKISILLFFVGLSIPLLAQIRVTDPKKTAERSVEGRVNNKIDQGINKGLDKVEEGIGNIFKKKDKKSKNKSSDQTTDEENPNRDGNNDTTNDDASETSGGNVKKETSTAGPKTLKAYSKFDFVPGEKVIVADDFSQDAVGDFPAKWNTNATGEIVTIEGKPGRWLKMAGSGFFIPEFVKTIPENTTIEFNAAVLDEYSYYCHGIMVDFVKQGTKPFEDSRPSFTGKVEVTLGPHGTNSSRGWTKMMTYDENGEEIIKNDKDQVQFVHRGIAPVARISIWRQKSRLRVYINEEKVWDIPRAFVPGINYTLRFASGACGESYSLI